MSISNTGMLVSKQGLINTIVEKNKKQHTFQYWKYSTSETQPPKLVVEYLVTL